jgi:hypothetical protein
MIVSENKSGKKKATEEGVCSRINTKFMKKQLMANLTSFLCLLWLVIELATLELDLNTANTSINEKQIIKMPGKISLFIIANGKAV